MLNSRKTNIEHLYEKWEKKKKIAKQKKKKSQLF